MPRLSICLITRDEATRLPGCLASLRPLNAEIIVVDTGSTDNTMSVARAAGARVIETPWTNDFSAARNVGLAEATGEWILAIDADEQLAAESCRRLEELTRRPANCGYEITQRSLLPNGDALDVAIVRLFPRHPRVRFERPIHEQVNTSLERIHRRIQPSGIVLTHSGYADAGAMPTKCKRNRRIIVETLEREPTGDPHLRYFLAASYLDVDDYEGAAREYERCINECAQSRPRLADAARVQAALCYQKMANHAAMASHLPTEITTYLHPNAALMRGESLLAASRSNEAQAWLEFVVAAEDRAYVPPVLLSPLRLQALNHLADIWAQRGRQDIAIRVLQLGVAVSQGIADFQGRTLGDQYRSLCDVANPRDDASVMQVA
jgi:tetratricopeptide (TPR) repeat protein